nr:glycine--tRNA ligase subunit beta [Succinivibrionaceae bacterium]
MSKNNLLVEIGTEELPPKALSKLAGAFEANVKKDLEAADLAFDSIKWYAAPRRLALKVTGLESCQPDKDIEKKGPALKAAYDKDGKPTKAAEGWAKSNGITVEQAEILKTDKGEWLFCRAHVKGKTVEELVPSMVQKALAALPVPKMMHWGATTFEFVRPVHTVTLLYGTEVIPCELFGIKSDRVVRGHRFMGSQLVTLRSADDYPELLEKEGMVIADYDKRKEIIRNAVIEDAKKLGGEADLDESLLDEVTSLAEYPVVLTAKFEEKFLKVPSEALVYTMKGDQKYFPVYRDGKLLPNFIFVANIQSKDPQAVISGNERVVRPRLSDAEFFYDTDRKHTLFSRLDSLDTVLFQKQLGSMKERALRISELAGYIASLTGNDVELSKRAGLLCKCDLMTNMVMEFTDTQGIMGMYYARLDGENEDVAKAIGEQYMPRFAGDRLPEGGVEICTALAEKLDTLTGIFGIGMPPKGDKDPFGLRRAAIGVLRIIVENRLGLDLEPIVAKAAELYGSKLTSKSTCRDVVDYVLGRFRSNFADEGIASEPVLAVLACRPTKPYDFDLRVRAVAGFAKNPAAPALAAANKRVSNILQKNNAADCRAAVSSDLLKEDAEKALYNAIESLRGEVTSMFDEGRYTDAMTKLAGLRDTVDTFFDKVMVMDKDEAVRNNRIALLASLRALFLRIADISVL